MSIKGTKTEKNLLASFAGESQARNRYTLFASKARKEGYEQIAAIFEETAENERLHAKTFFNFLEGGAVEITAMYPAGKVGTTTENLKASAMGENEEHSKLYPEFAKIAEEEGFKDVAFMYTKIAKIEKHHEERYLQLLNNIEKDIVFNRDSSSNWKCRKCGHIHTADSPPEKCPVCDHPKSYFEIQCECF